MILKSVHAMESVSVTIACCGIFHYKNYVADFARSGNLRQFIFSHRLGCFRGQSWATNMWHKEHLRKLMQFAAPESLHDDILPMLHDIWDFQAASSYLDAEVAHVMLHGTSARLMKRARAGGAVILGEAVNTHPDNLWQVLELENLACGIPNPKSRPKQYARMKEEIDKCDWILTPSTQVKRSYIQRGWPSDRISCIPFGANLERFRLKSGAAPRCERRVDAICVAQVVPRKGIHYLIEAWRQAGLGNATLRIVGIVPKRMQHVIADAPPNVVFTGALPAPKVTELLLRSSVFILPTLEEGLPYSIMEAMAAGCAVITTPASGAEDVMLSGKSGLIVPVRDVQALAAAIDLLARDVALRVALGAEARKAVHDKLNWNNYCAELIALYSQVKQSGRRCP